MDNMVEGRDVKSTTIELDVWMDDIVEDRDVK